jgi:hypothetical protein
MSYKSESTVKTDYRLPRGSREEGGCRLPASARAKAGTPPVGPTVPISYLRNAVPLASSSLKAMFLQVGGKAYQVTSFVQASQMFCIARDKNGEGASNTPSPLIVDDAGLVIAHVSYNGRVWSGDAWTIDAILLYDNRVA